MQKTSPEISELKKRIETDLKHKMRTPNDFIFLVGAVWERTRQTISPTTLKRLWGYIDGADETRSSTLEILSRFLGYDNWDDFVKEIGQESNSDPVTSPHINADMKNITRRRNRLRLYRRAPVNSATLANPSRSQ